MSQILNYFKKQKDILEDKLRETSQNPSRKNVHHLRVAVRRMRATLWLAEQADPKLSFKKLSSSLKKIGGALGEQRELDVAIKDATTYEFDEKSLKLQRRIVRKFLRKKLNRKFQRTVMDQIEKATQKLIKYHDLNLKKGTLRLSKKIKSYTGKKIRNQEFHQVRITTKKTRYALEAMGKPVEPLRDLQDVLGRGHDLEVLQDLLGRNKKVQKDMTIQYQKAKRMMPPAFRFAIGELQTKN